MPTVLPNGQAIEQKRIEKGWRQVDLARKAGISEKTMSRVERREPVFITTLELIARALKTPVNSILAHQPSNIWPTGGRHVRKVNFILHFGQKLGREFTTPRILQELARVKGKVVVLGRTCRSWLVECGQTRTSQLQDLIVEAARESDIHLVVQKPIVKVPFFSAKDLAHLRKHLRESITSYLTIRDKLRDENIPEERVKLSFTDQPIVQSMTKIKREQDGYGWLLVSVRTDFKPEERQFFPDEPSSVNSGRQSFKWDPQIIFRTDAPQAEEFLDRFKVIHPVKYRDYLDSLLKRINETVSQYGHGSPLRKDTGANLAGQAVRHFLSRSTGHDRPSPVCVQLLVTSRCPGHCPMCKQWKRKLRDPGTDEVKDLLRHISGLGARSVVISGGDPLYREDIFEILEFASKEGELPSGKSLDLGIMTRGICLKNNHPSALEQDDANRLAQACCWIQISMDTFVHSPDGTEQFSRRDCNLEKAVTSAKCIWSAVKKDKSRVEICFTIHKYNIREIDKIFENARQIGIPEGMPIRLKFAHSGTSGAPFLCSRKDFYRLKETLQQLAEKEDKNHNTNAQYLWNMMDSDSEMVRNVANGHPVETALRLCEKRGDKCYVQDLICVIDCDGKVFPCCYLLDDTAESSAAKPIGTLCDEGTHPILSFSNHQDELKNIWQNREASPNLPVNSSACARCTRHLHQNELLNKIQSILDEGSPLRIAEELENALNQKTVVDGCEWCREEDKYFWL